ncbi:hypothetical protein [Kribbella speibonae]|uniref:ABM domain-containing protein n=1 Tax=Kribbella speibonae TaxID=1572660 RepID=A0ABY2A652_9ACTN|nr:hypothetical protein [Kribbella speibonae]TCC22701.1 hypothetical protein E0H58_20155 [Kribbella speibonae]
MAAFVQIIEYRTSKPDEIAALMADFQAKREAAGDGPAPTRSIAGADRDDPGRYFAIVEFESYEAAMENSQRADTTEMSEKMMELCDGPATFYNLDQVASMD